MLIIVRVFQLRQIAVMSDMAMLRQLTQTSSSRNFGGVVWRAPCCWDRVVDHVLEGNPTVPVINGIVHADVKQLILLPALRTVTIFEG